MYLLHFRDTSCRRKCSRHPRELVLSQGLSQVIGDILVDDFHLFTAVRTLAIFFTELLLNGIVLDVLGKLC